MFDTPFDVNGTIASGTWTFYYKFTDNKDVNVGYFEACVYSVTVSGGAIDTSSLKYDTSSDSTPPASDIWVGGVTDSSYATSSLSQMSFNQNEYLYVEYWTYLPTIDAAGKATDFTSTLNIGGATVSVSPRIVTPLLTIPENALILGASVPVIIIYILWTRKKRLNLGINK